MSPSHIAASLKVLRSGWVSIGELAKATGRVNIDTSRAFLHQMVAAGVCRMRHRERPMRDDGTRIAGRCAREYRLHTDFGGLS